MIVIALGANVRSRVGEPRDTLDAALRELSARGVRVADISSYYVSKAWPDPSDPAFVNAVARIETNLATRELMTLLHGTEEVFGRIRARKNAPRTLDLDLVLFGNAVIQEPDLVVPHPRFRTRRFVLEPLAEIAPDLIDPVSGETIAMLLSRAE